MDEMEKLVKMKELVKDALAKHFPVLKESFNKGYSAKGLGKHFQQELYVWQDAKKERYILQESYERWYRLDSEQDPYLDKDNGEKLISPSVNFICIRRDDLTDTEVGYAVEVNGQWLGTSQVYYGKEWNDAVIDIYNSIESSIRQKQKKEVDYGSVERW